MRTNTLLHLWMMGERCNTIRQLFAMSFQTHLDVTWNRFGSGSDLSQVWRHTRGLCDGEQNSSPPRVKEKSGSCQGDPDLDKIWHCAGGQRGEGEEGESSGSCAATSCSKIITPFLFSQQTDHNAGFRTLSTAGYIFPTMNIYRQFTQETVERRRN